PLDPQVPGSLAQSRRRNQWRPPRCCKNSMSSYARGQISPDGRYVWDGTAWTPSAAAPFDPPAWLSPRLAEKATWLAPAAALIVGLLADQFFRVGVFGLAASAMVTAAAIALVVTGRVHRVEPLVLTALAVVFGACLTLRASPWLVWPDLAFAAVLLWSAASIARRGSLLDLG